MSIKRWLFSLKLKQKTRYLFLFILSVYLLLYLFIYSFLFNSYMTDYALENNRNSLLALGDNVTEKLNNISDMSRLIMANNDVARYLKNKNNDILKYSQDAVTAIFDIISIYSNINSIFIFKPDGNYIHTGRDITYVNKSIVNDPEWQKEVHQKAGSYIIRFNGDGAFSMKTGEPIFSFIRQINDLNTQEILGMLVINVPFSMLENITKDTVNKSYSYYDRDSNLLTQNNVAEALRNLDVSKQPFEQKVTRTLFKEDILSYYHVPNTSLVIASYESIGLNEIFSKETAWMLIITLIITVLALILISSFISYYVTTPIQRLVQSMNLVKSGKFRRVSLALPNDEIGHLKDSYNEMLLEINQLINELISKEKTIQKAELEVLQEQIKPHFLYNTLGTISYMALEKSADNVYEALETLGDFYRKFLCKGERVITIENEISIVKDYLKLQKLRYGDIFDDIYEIQDDLLQVKIPKLILQPLVENSLYHGIRLTGERGFIKITIYSKDGFIHIVVFDNGIGMSPEKIENIMTTDQYKNFGFKGTIERIKYYYGCNDVYEIRSEEGKFTEIAIKIAVEKVVDKIV